MTKTTNKTALLYAIENLPDAPAEILEKLTKMVDQLDRKNAAPRKMTEKQTHNEAVKVAILDFLADHEGEGFTCSDLIKVIPALEGTSNQYVSALMRSLYEAHKVEKYTEKRRTYFRFVVDSQYLDKEIEA